MRLHARSLPLFAANLALACSLNLHAQQSPEQRLAECRSRIDATDARIVQLLQQRARIVHEVGEIKREAHLPVNAPAREQQVLDHIVQLGKEGPLPPESLRRIYQTLIREMREWEAGLIEHPAAVH